MRHHRLSVLLAGLLALSITAPPASAQPGRDAYRYLDDPTMVGEGQEAPHAELRPFGNVQAALKGDPNTPWTRSLDGDWRIRMFDKPQDVPADIATADPGGWRTVSVPHTWQTDGLDHPIFRNIPTEMYPDDPPRVPHDINPTGVYSRTFDQPADWVARRSVLRFEGVTSGYFVWVNGAYVGYDQGGYTPAEFDIGRHLRAGRNTVTVQVHRWGAGSHLEDYDQWRFSGIFRSVWLYSTPTAYLRDVTVKTDLDAQYRDATLSVDVAVAGAQAGHRVRSRLFDARGHEVSTVDGPTRIADPAKWTDETPNLYTLVVELLDSTGRTVHVTRQPVGFRKIEIRDRQLLVNGKRVLFKGVNRAETSVQGGRHVTAREQERDVELMKQLNVNAVRTSHYPSDPYFYDLADRRGLWIDDEIDAETHHHDGCPNNCLAERPEWQAAFMDRFTAMVQRDKNHPSVFLWDTGNEAGLGKAHYAMAEYAKATDPSRPLYHQSNSPDGDAPFADVWGPRYPSPDGLAAQAARTTKPIIMGEYAHAMGNSLGNFQEFWNVIRAHPQTQGGFIWDWAEQNIELPLKTTPDSSGNDILTWLTGQPSVVDGPKGKALSLSGLDDFVEVYRDRKFDEVGAALTLDAWVKPAKPWTGDFTVVAKGDHQYALKMPDEHTLQFFVYGDGGYHTVSAKVPADFYDAWHRVTGVFDGEVVRLLVDGTEIGRTAWHGTIDRSNQPVNIGRNPETMQEWATTRMAHGAIDQVRVYHRALTGDELTADPKNTAVLALDFERFDDRGKRQSYGAGTGGVDGLVNSDRSLQPETAELAAVHSPIRIANPAPDTLSITNERVFTGTDDLELRWRVEESGHSVADGRTPLRIAAGTTGTVALPRPPDNPTGVERLLTVEAVDRTGHAVSTAQFGAGGDQIAGIASPEPVRAVDVRDTAGEVVVTGKDFRYTLDKKAGTLTSMRVRGTELLRGGPKLDAWRAPTSNETNSEDGAWYGAGLDRLATTPSTVNVQRNDTDTVITVDATAAAPGVTAASFGERFTYLVRGNGEIRVTHRLSARDKMRDLPYLPGVGFTLAVPQEFQRFSWYGRGPGENYVDRLAGTPIDVYQSTVDKQYVDYHRPQDNGNHTDVRWAALTDGRTGGLLVAGDLDVRVSRYDDLDRAAYPFARKENAGWTTLHVDHAVSGVGETFHEPLPPYQVEADGEYAYSVLLRPMSAVEVATGKPGTKVTCAPRVAVTPAQATLEPGASATVDVAVTNPCRTPLDRVTARVDVPAGWTAPPATDLGALAPGASRTVPVVITRGADTPSGTRAALVEVAARSNGSPVDANTSLKVVATPAPPHGDTAVSTLEFLAQRNGWGPVERDRSNGEQGEHDGNPLTIGGTTYATGLGAHAVSVVEVYLGGRCRSFTAQVGVDDETSNAGSVAFEVLADGASRYTSPRLTGTDPALPVTVDVTGAQVLRLRVNDGADGNAWDHADWADAYLHCS
jgi:beta-galactosidase